MPLPCECSSHCPHCVTKLRVIKASSIVQGAVLCTKATNATHAHKRRSPSCSSSSADSLSASSTTCPKLGRICRSPLAVQYVLGHRVCDRKKKASFPSAFSLQLELRMCKFRPKNVAQHTPTRLLVFLFFLRCSSTDTLLTS